MGIIIGSARGAETGGINGRAGDQLQRDTWDFFGEVSLEGFYQHKKGWDVLRAKSKAVADGIAKAMCNACINHAIGYSQRDRYDVVKLGTRTNKPCGCDCSSLVRRCVMEASGQQIPDFHTGNEKAVLLKTGLFKKVQLRNPDLLRAGDILITKTKGHTAVVVQNVVTEETVDIKDECYPAYHGCTVSLVNALLAVGERDITYRHRAKIAAVNFIVDYKGTAAQNMKLLNMLKAGTLRRV